MTEQTHNRAAMLGAALDAALVLGGAIVVSVGAWMVYEPAGFIVGGGIAMALGLRKGKA